jgi:hypothetical protein
VEQQIISVMKPGEIIGGILFVVILIILEIRLTEIIKETQCVEQLIISEMRRGVITEAIQFVARLTILGTGPIGIIAAIQHAVPQIILAILLVDDAQQGAPADRSTALRFRVG